MRHALATIALAAALAGCGAPSNRPAGSPDLGSTTSLLRMGDEMRTAGDPAGAAQFYQNALQKEPSDPRPMLRLGEMRLSLGDAASAEGAYRAAAAIEPGNVDAANGLGSSLLAQGARRGGAGGAGAAGRDAAATRS